MTRRFIIFLSIVLMLGACVSKKRFLTLQAEKDHLALSVEKTRIDLQDQINELKRQNVRLVKDKNDITEDITVLEGQLDDTEQKVREVEFNLQDKQYQISQIWNEMDAAFSKVEQAVATSNQRIDKLENFLYLSLEDVPTFESGSDEVQEKDISTLEKIAGMLNENPSVTMVIEGHTDTRPISSEKYRDNWDLSVSRSTQVIRKLVELGVNPAQLIASGRGEYMPDSDKEINVNPADLRRAEFILVPNIGKLYQIYNNQKKNKRP